MSEELIYPRTFLIAPNILIMVLLRKYDAPGTPKKKSNQKAHLRRVRVLRETLQRIFPDTEIYDPIKAYSWGSEWQFIIRDPDQKHIEWAEHAWKCGFIDTCTAFDFAGRKIL